MKSFPDQHIAEIKRKFEQTLERTEEHWQLYWEQTWSHRFENISAKMKQGTARSLSILNGLVGDYLVEKGVPIAVQMAFYHQQQPLELSADVLAKAFADSNGKLCVMVHGLSCNENVWQIDGDPQDTYAQRLAQELGYTPLYIRYNTGLHISHNGQMLSLLMLQLLEAFPVDVEEVVFITHSMGGLVTRSACYYGSFLAEPWTDKVRQLYFLGSPHLGADLEKFGNVVAQVLKSSPLPYTRFVAELLNKRSVGIKDLRFGYVRDEDWQGQDPDQLLSNNRDNVPLLAGAEHFVITGTVHEDGEHILSQFFGDALVRKYSATGQSNNDKLTIPFLPQNQVELTKVNHVQLTRNERVYQQILDWIKTS